MTDRPSPDAGQNADAARIVELIQKQNIAMVTTVAADGTMKSRPMGIQKVTEEGDLWFFLGRSSDQAQSIGRNPELNVSLTSSDHWVSVAGRGTLVRDPHLIDEMWDDMVAGYFEGGKEDPEVALLHVRAESAEYWDTPGGKVTALLDFVKSKVTGKPMSGENAATEL